MQVTLIAGLGNPGQKYLFTRHNVGFMAVDAIAHNLNLEFREKRGKRYYAIAETQLPDGKLILLKPLEFMNNSGWAISQIVNYYNINLSRLLVLHDDMDVQFGRIKLVRRGGHGGHNGIRSIIQQLGSKEFPRLKIGIGRPPVGMDPVNYVLQPFQPDQLKDLGKILDFCAEATMCFVRYGIEKAMNDFNGKRILD